MLSKLPRPANKKSGWPWDESTIEPPTVMSDGSEWPKISIVTPSYNQGDFIEETIRSVLSQRYPNLEYIVVDGGSTDATLDTIKKYDPWLTHWISEPDNGQSDAINKGFAKSTGQIMGWLNSDDLLQPNALFVCAEALTLDSPDWLTAPAKIIDRCGKHIKTQQIERVSIENFYSYQVNWIPQQSTFWNRLMWECIGPLRADLHYVMDVDLFFRMLQVSDSKISSLPLSAYRYHSDAKTISKPDNSNQEYAEWFSDQVLSERFVSKGRLKIDLSELIKNNIAAQARMQRIERHIVIGSIIQFWIKYINPSLAVK